MKTLAALILCAMLAGCHNLKSGPATPYDAPTARLGDAKSEASSISEALNTSTTNLNTDCDSLNDLVNEGRALVPQLADYWNRLAKAVQKVRDDVPKSAADRQVALVTKIGSVQAQVDALTKENADLKAENAKLKLADRPNTKGYLALGLALLVLGAIAYVKFDKQAGGAGMLGGGIYIAAGIFLPSLIDGAPYLIYGLYALAGVVVVFFVYRGIKTRIALKQTMKPIGQALETIPAPEAAWIRSLLSQSQDDSTKSIVTASKDKVVTPQAIEDAKRQKEAISQLQTVIPPSPLPPATLPGLVGSEATVAAGAATVTGPVVPNL